MILGVKTASIMRKRQRRASVFAAVLALSMLVVFMLSFQAEHAYAKSYDMPQTDIAAKVQPNGDIQIEERRVFEFDGSFSLVGWSFDGLPYDASLQVDSVKVKRLGSSEGNGSSSGEGYLEYGEVPFNSAWRTEGTPGNGYYSVDALYDTVYVFSNVYDESIEVELAVTIVDGVAAYRDVAEVYWKYVGEGWDAASDNVTCTVELPVPEGESVIAGENVRAWGHGPLDGSLEVNANGSVVYTSPHVPSGEYAEARILFPAEWLTEVPLDSAIGYRNYDHLQDVLDEEQAWADEANMRRIRDFAFVVVGLLVCIGLAVWSVIMFFKYGKEHKSGFREGYWRDVPDPNVGPAVIGRLRRWDHEDSKDFTATLMHLAHVGAITLSKGTYADDKGALVEDYYMNLVPEVADALTDPLDVKTIELMFDKFAYGRNKVGGERLPSLWFDTIKMYGKKRPGKFMDQMSSWQGELTSIVGKQDYFELKSAKIKGTMTGVAILVLGASIALLVMTVNFMPAILGIPTALAMLVLAHFMSRRTRHGNDVYEKSEALKRWLQEFSAIDERPPSDVKVWGEFMVYAYEFGIADRVLKELRDKIPEVLDQPGYAQEGGFGYGYVPWWYWYHAGPAHAGGMGMSISSAFDQAMGNTISTAKSALSAASGGSGGGFSSAGGGGGGFSAGGGGGFGGGGFAR